MKKFLSIIFCILISAGAACAAASCGAYGLGSDRGTVTARNIYFKQSDSEKYNEFLIRTSRDEWLDYKTSSGNYYFAADEPDVEGFSSSYAVYDYDGKITEKSSLPSGHTAYGLVYERAVKNFIAEDIAADIGEEVVAANVVVLEGFFFINVFSASHGNKLYKEEVITSYLGYIDCTNGDITLYSSYNDGRVFFYFNYKYSVYELNGAIYSYSHDGTEVKLFDDNEYERPLQHDNAINVYYTGAYLYFERVRDCAGYLLTTYSVAAIDGSHVVDMCTVKHKG